MSSAVDDCGQIDASRPKLTWKSACPYECLDAVVTSCNATGASAFGGADANAFVLRSSSLVNIAQCRFLSITTSFALSPAMRACHLIRAKCTVRSGLALQRDR